MGGGAGAVWCSVRSMCETLTAAQNWSMVCMAVPSTPACTAGSWPEVQALRLQHGLQCYAPCIVTCSVLPVQHTVPSLHHICSAAVQPPAVHPPAVPAAPVHRPVLPAVQPAGGHATVQLHSARPGLLQPVEAHSQAYCLQDTHTRTHSNMQTAIHDPMNVYPLTEPLHLPYIGCAMVNDGRFLGTFQTERTPTAVGNIVCSMQSYSPHYTNTHRACLPDPDAPWPVLHCTVLCCTVLLHVLYHHWPAAAPAPMLQAPGHPSLSSGFS